MNFTTQVFSLPSLAPALPEIVLARSARWR